MSDRELPDFLIGGVTQTNLGNALRGVSFPGKPSCQRRWELRVDEESHAAVGAA